MMNPDDYFSSYEDWREALTQLAGLALTPEYCNERLRALEDCGDASTKQFIDLYGLPYRDKVIGWFKQAARSN